MRNVKKLLIDSALLILLFAILIIPASTFGPLNIIKFPKADVLSTQNYRPVEVKKLLPEIDKDKVVKESTQSSMSEYSLSK